MARTLRSGRRGRSFKSSHPVITGLIVGTGLSIPTSIITRVYAPIIGIGVVGGLIMGLITNAMVF